MTESPSPAAVPTGQRKARLRRQVREQRRGVDADRVARISASIRERLLEVIEPVGSWQVVGVYAAMPGEVDLDDLVEALVASGRSVAFPRVLAAGEMEFRLVGELSELTARSVGDSLPPIREPSPEFPAADPDVLCVPGLAFDALGGRLGHGGGFYDRFLATHPGTATIGVCSAADLLPSVPIEEHDVKMDAVITEDDVYRF